MMIDININNIIERYYIFNQFHKYKRVGVFAREKNCFLTSFHWYILYTFHVNSVLYNFGGKYCDIKKTKNAYMHAIWAVLR